VSDEATNNFQEVTMQPSTTQSQQLVPMPRSESQDDIVHALEDFVRRVAARDGLTAEGKVKLARQVFEIQEDAARAQNAITRMHWERQVIEEEGRRALLLAQQRSAWALEQAASEEASRHILAKLRHRQLVEEARRHLVQTRGVPAEGRAAARAHRALKRDCERIALDVSTGTLLFNDHNLYHGFAALKYQEALKTLTPADAIHATVDALIWRRYGQPEITVAEAQAFVDQYERTITREVQGEAFTNAASILHQFGIGTEDDYETSI
jgi:hypothetical protein